MVAGSGSCSASKSATASASAAGSAVDQRSFGELVDQPPRRVEACRGGLGDIGDATSAQRAQCRPGGPDQLLSVKDDGAARDPAAATDIAHRRQPERGLARAALADQTQHVPRAKRQVDAPDNG